MPTPHHRFCAGLLLLASCSAPVGLDPDIGGGKAALRTVRPVVGPLIQTRWGQGGRYRDHTPVRSGAPTYPGCTTIASAQILYYYRYQARATRDVCYGLEHGPLEGPDVVDRGYTLCVGLAGAGHDFSAMALDLDGASESEIDATSRFIYHVGASLNAQFGGGEGSSATGKQTENAFRYQWGFNNISRRQMSVISKSAFGYSDAEWAQLMRDELDAGRPVLYMALQEDADAGHAFVIDGYSADGRVHVNFGWAGHGNGWYDPNVLEDPSARRWNRNPLIFRGLEPEPGFAAAMAPPARSTTERRWDGTASLISLASETDTGYGLTIDEAQTSPGNGVVFFQWEIDARDGRRLSIQAPGASQATITYGDWRTRADDRVYRDVALPFVLDPAKDGHRTTGGAYFVVAVEVDASETTPVIAEPTSDAASQAISEAAGPLRVGGRVWNGNGSLISLASGTRTGYGLTHDETRIHPGADAPVVFYQWEIDGRDGRRLLLEADGASEAVLTYGPWNERDGDVTRRLTLPATIDPAADGLPSEDRTYLVLQLAFDEAPSAPTPVLATIVP